MINNYTCYRHRGDRLVLRLSPEETVPLCSLCVASLRRVARMDQHQAEEEHFVVYVQAENREVERYTATEGLSEALAILEDLKEVYALVFILRGMRSYGLARGGVVREMV